MLFSEFKSDTEPDTLANICLECIAKNLSDIFPLREDGYDMGPDIVIPKEICESLVVTYQRSGRLVDDKFINLFINMQKSGLQKVTIWNSSITDDGLRKVLRFNLKELDLAYCSNLSEVSFDLINLFGMKLRSLSIGCGMKIITPEAFSESKKRPPWNTCNDSIFGKRGYVFKAPNLTRLVLKNVKQEPRFFETLLESLPKLTHLDLSCCLDLGNLFFITLCPNLKSLILFNCPKLQTCILNICRLTKLRHLDISQSDEQNGIYEEENKILKKIVASLPNLVSLDISGTNLAGKGNVEKDLFVETEEYHSDIPGLAGRTESLQFLGLYGTQHRACKRFDIPAIKISGDANESQILTAGTVYMDRPQMLHRVFNDLFYFLRTDNCVNMPKILRVILEGLNTHAQEKHIQIAGSAALYYIVKRKNPHLLTPNVKKLIITTLLNSITLHMKDETMLRNGCLTLCQFQIPQDILFVYHKLVKLLLQIIMAKEQEAFVQRVGIYLMNLLACQVNDTQKEILGNLGIIEKMLTLITTKIEQETCDDVLEVAWSAMWNVTDETPVNCQRFLDSGGMTCFIYCLEKFREKNELMRNMMGLLGNVAEVQELRNGLMPYISIFYDLVDSFQDGIEVSYNAAGVISHIASDGPSAWVNTDVNREAVLTKMVDAIERWDLSSERNINYRSFEPILKLTRVRHTPACQLWAIWALTNLTKVYPEKYCPILEAENGLKDVEALAEDDNTKYPQIRGLAQTVLDNYRMYKQIAQRNDNHADAMLVVEIVE